MNRNEVDWKSGEVTYWDLDDIDQSRPLTDFLPILKEDHGQIKYPGKFLIDIGWHTSPRSAGGLFKLVVIKKCNWRKPLMRVACPDIASLKQACKEAVELVEHLRRGRRFRK
jgi:hypothetical protein